MTRTRGFLAATVLVLLAACGGGSDDDQPSFFPDQEAEDNGGDQATTDTPVTTAPAAAPSCDDDTFNPEAVAQAFSVDNDHQVDTPHTNPVPSQQRAFLRCSYGEYTGGARDIGFEVKGLTTTDLDEGVNNRVWNAYATQWRHCAEDGCDQDGARAIRATGDATAS